PDKEDPELPEHVKKFVAMTNTRSIMAIVMKDARQRTAFGLMLESEKHGFFEASEGPPKTLENADSVALSLWVADKAAKALIACRTFRSIPFARFLVWMRNARL